MLEKFEAIAVQNSLAMQTQAVKVQQVTFTSLYVIAILMALMTGLAIWFAIRTAKQTTAPIAILSKAADSLASGKLKRDIAVTGNNEFTALTTAFNQMRQAIEDKTNALEKHKHELVEQVAQRTEELAISRDLAEQTLLSIRDAVISTDCDENITMMNPVAEQLTGWVSKDAIGQKIDTIFQVINEQTKEPVECPIACCINTNRVVLLGK
ncbi:MAG: HAMP domain-containing protein [Cycloclasticus sp.]|nr:HAMP domain-containing protein [Cycloclasticus sp.]